MVRISLGIRHGFGLFLQPVTLDDGWPREAFALAVAVQNLVWGPAQPVAGWLADRFGTTPVMLGGALLYVAGLALMAVPLGVTAFVLAPGLLVGLGLAGTTLPILLGAIGRAVPAPAAGGGGPGAVAVARRALADRDLRLLAAGFFVCGRQVVFVATHLPAFLAERGVGAGTASLVLAIVGLVNVAGTLWGGLARRTLVETAAPRLELSAAGGRHRAVRSAAGDPTLDAHVRRGTGPSVAVDRAADQRHRRDTVQHA